MGARRSRSTPAACGFPLHLHAVRRAVAAHLMESPQSVSADQRKAGIDFVVGVIAAAL
jgi:hypothetical protein